MEFDSLGSRVKKLRKQKNLTQIELGKLSGIHYTNIGRIENKGAIPQADVLYLIAKSLDTTVSWLLTGKTDNANPETIKELETAEYPQQQSDALQIQIIQLLQRLTEGEKMELLAYMKYLYFHKHA